MCASGVTAQVLPDATGNPAYSSIWGSIVGFDVANTAGTGADAGADAGNTRMAYDAPAHGITGFAFDIDNPPPGGHLRVTFQPVGTENAAAYWGGATMDASPIGTP